MISSRFILFLLLVALVCSANAETLTATASRASITAVRSSSNPAQWTLTWSDSSGTVIGQTYGYCRWGVVTADGIAATSYLFFHNAGATGGSSGTATVTVPAGQYIHIYAGTNYLGSNAGESGGSEWLSSGLNSHTVTVSPATSSLLRGQQVLLTASGGQNGYQWSVMGGGGLNIFSDGTASYVGSAPGTYTVKVWSNAGGGYERSNDATATITVAESFKKSVSMKGNNGSRPVKYRVFQGGEMIAEYVQMPGDSARIVTVIVDSNEPLTVSSQVVGIIQDESTGTWHVDPSSVSRPVVTPPVVPTPTFEPDTDPIIAPDPNVPNDTPPTTGDQTTKRTWSSVTVNSNPANQTDLLTNTTFREGVDKITEPLNAWEKARQEAQKMADSWFGPNNGSTAVQSAWDGAQNKFTDIASKDADKLTEKAVTTAEVVPFAIPAAGALSLGADIDSGLPGGKWKLEPFTIFPWLQTMLLVIREIILWAMGWMFYAAAQAKLERIQFALSLVPQVDVQNGEQIVVQGNQVPGSSTAVALTKRLLVAGAIIGTIHIQLAALITAWNSRMGQIFGTEWTFADVGNIATKVQAVTGGPIGTALRIMDTVFPVTAGVAYIVVWGLFSWACVLTYAAASAAIKAIKI